MWQGGLLQSLLRGNPPNSGLRHRSVRQRARVVVCPPLIERSVTVVPTAFVSTTKLCITIPKDNMPVMVISSIGIARLNSTN
jgi:hypothetical protein